MTAWLSEAGDRLRSQINRAYPHRDTASEGWIGTGGDHAPAASGVVRAVDIDSSFGGKPGYNTTEQAWQVANQLRRAMLNGDRRVAYIIAWDPMRKADYICSMNTAYSPLGGWRVYTGDSHINHIHVSFTPAGDRNGRPFNLPALAPTVPQRLLEAKDTAARRIRRILRNLKQARNKLGRIRGRISERRNK